MLSFQSFMNIYQATKLFSFVDVTALTLFLLPSEFIIIVFHSPMMMQIMIVKPLLIKDLKRGGDSLPGKKQRVMITKGRPNLHCIGGGTRKES